MYFNEMNFKNIDFKNKIKLYFKVMDIMKKNYNGF